MIRIENNIYKIDYDIVVIRVIFLISTSLNNIIFIYINIVSRYGISKYIIYRFIYIDEVSLYISLSLALYSIIIYSLLLIRLLFSSLSILIILLLIFPLLIFFPELAIDITIIILILQRYNQNKVLTAFIYQYSLK